MSGINLMEMEASDMMDVLHFLFEEDFVAVSEDNARSRSGVRDAIYSDMYGVKYPYKMKDPKGRNQSRNADLPAGYQDTIDDFEPVEPFSPRDAQKKQQPSESKIKFVSAESVPVVAQSFDGLDGALN